MGKLFTPKRIEDIRSLYAHLPENNRPRVYWVACTQRGQRIREKLETWAAPIAQDTLDKLLPNLMSRENFRGARGELLAMYYFHCRGFSLEYAPLIEDKTPDLRVSVPDTEVSFIAEVYAEDKAQDEQKRQHWVDDLYARIQKLDYGYRVDADFGVVSADWDDNRTKAVAAEFGQWFATCPKRGDAREVDGVRISVRSKVCTQGAVRIDILSMGAGWVDTERERPKKKIKGKVAEYRQLICTCDAPFVVVYIPEFTTGTDAGGMDDALFGKDGVRVTINKATGELVAAEPCRQADGLFSKGNSALAGVLLLSEVGGEISPTWRLNPGARYRLPSWIAQQNG